MTTQRAQFEESSLAACCAQFPRACSTCRRVHLNFPGYLEATKPIGAPRLDPDDDEDDAIGLLSFANCPCGSTLALRYEDVTRHAAFNQWVRQTAAEAKQSQEAVVTALVAAVNTRARTLEVGPTVAEAVPESVLLDVGAAMVATLSKGAALLPPFPAVAFKVAELARDPSSTPDQVARAIAGDPTLAAELLQLVNAPLYARSTPVSSLPVAITRLGMKEVARLGLAAGVGSSSARPGVLMVVRQHLWHRSVTTAVVARALASKRAVNPEEAFLAGLLQPLGSIVGTLSLEIFLAQHPAFAAQPLAAWLRLLELFRAELGALTAARWSLPAGLKEAITSRPGSAIAPEHAKLNDLVGAAADVARRFSEVDTLTLEDLSKVAALSPEERALLQKDAPRLAEAIASFEDTPLRQGPSKVAPPAPAPLGAPPAGEVVLANVRRRSERFRVRSFTPRALVLEGHTGLPENLATGFEVVGPANLQFYTVCRSSTAVGSTVQILVEPFCLSAEAHRQLQALCAP